MEVHLFVDDIVAAISCRDGFRFLLLRIDSIANLFFMGSLACFNGKVVELHFQVLRLYGLMFLRKLYFVLLIVP